MPPRQLGDQKWVVRLHVRQFDFFVFRNHDVWWSKVPKDIVLIMQDLQSKPKSIEVDPSKSAGSASPCLAINVLHHKPSEDAHMKGLLLKHQPWRQVFFCEQAMCLDSIMLDEFDDHRPVIVLARKVTEVDSIS